MTTVSVGDFESWRMAARRLLRERSDLVLVTGANLATLLEFVFGDERGFGAIYEAARILDQFRTQLREPNRTYNPSVIGGGTNVSNDTASKSGTALGKTTVIPREVRVEGDIRYLGAAQFESTRQKMLAIVAAHLPRTQAVSPRRARGPNGVPGEERSLRMTYPYSCKCGNLD